MKRKHRQTFSRNATIIVEVRAPKNSNYKLEGNILDEMESALPIENVHATLSRSREAEPRKGPKIICDIPYRGVPSLSLNEPLLTFDYVYAVDTNTKHIADNWLSAGCICCLNSCTKNETQYTYEISFVQQVTSINSFCRYQMEQHVWNAAIAYIQSVVPANSTVALIVDCDIGNIPQYNKRKLKIRDAAYLPENFTLVYASADSGDTIANKIISYCDSCASKVLEQLILQTKE